MVHVGLDIEDRTYIEVVLKKGEDASDFKMSDPVLLIDNNSSWEKYDSYPYSIQIHKDAPLENGKFSGTFYFYESKASMICEFKPNLAD